MRDGRAWPRWAPDALGLFWTVAAALAVMAPVLRPGVSLGSFDLLSRVGLTQQPHVAVHSLFPADQILYFVPLTNLAWHQVHSGQLPLWNPYNVLGVPLAFDWQSGVFSLPLALSLSRPRARRLHGDRAGQVRHRRDRCLHPVSGPRFASLECGVRGHGVRAVGADGALLGVGHDGRDLLRRLHRGGHAVACCGAVTASATAPSWRWLSPSPSTAGTPRASSSWPCPTSCSWPWSSPCGPAPRARPCADP